MSKVEPVSVPNHVLGTKYIFQFIIKIKIFEICVKNFSPKDTKELFGTIFNDDASHLIDKYNGLNFGSFFLNLDDKNTIAFLNYLSSDGAQITLPNIENWEQIGANYGMDQWPEFTQEDVRSICTGFNELSEWDVYPHQIVWLRKFVLYASNNAISDNNYKGENFGDYNNWAKYFSQLPTNSQISLVKKLQHYD